MSRALVTMGTLTGGLGDFTVFSTYLASTENSVGFSNTGGATVVIFGLTQLAQYSQYKADAHTFAFEAQARSRVRLGLE